MNKKILISAGPMRTSIDAVRFLQNRSSGLMGLELALAFQNLGHPTTLLLGNVEDAIVKRSGTLNLHRFESCQDYSQKLEELFPQCDVFVSAAAVLDFSVIPSPNKIKREELGEELCLKIVHSPDFVALMAQKKSPSQEIIAFALETGSKNEVIEQAQKKLKRKSVDWIVANPASKTSGPDSPNNQVWLLDRAGQLVFERRSSPKSEIACSLVDIFRRQWENPSS